MVEGARVQAASPVRKADIIITPGDELMPVLAVVEFANPIDQSNAEAMLLGWLGRLRRYFECGSYAGSRSLAEKRR